MRCTFVSMGQLLLRLFDRIDNSSLVAFRIGLGFMFFAESWGAILTGWVRVNMIEPKYHFGFIGLDWIDPLPGEWMYLYFVVMGLAGLGVMLGWRYRWSAAAFFVLWTGTYLMQKTSYNNHYYLMVLLSAAMIVLPAHRWASLDVRRNPAIKSPYCERWHVGSLVAFLSMVYVYAAIAKLQADWIGGDATEIMFENRSRDWLVGPLFEQEWFQLFIAWGGIGFDLTIPFFLLWHRTRPVAVVVSIFFHLFNSAVLHIGVFPYMMIIALVLFFRPEQVRRRLFRMKPPIDTILAESWTPGRRLTAAALGLFFVWQLLLPMRHHLIPGDVNWTEEGHRMSWRMMLRAKSGSVSVYVVLPDGERIRHNINDDLRPKQRRRIATRPDMMWQYVQYLKRDYAERGYPEVEIYAESKTRLNRHPRQTLYDPTVDLAKVEWKWWGHKEWVTEMEE